MFGARKTRIAVVGAVIGGAIAIAGGVSAAAQLSTGTNTTPVPAFTGLDTAPAQMPNAVQDALDKAGAPRSADARSIDFGAGYSASVVRTPEKYYLAVHEDGSQITSTVEAPMANIAANGGTWAFAGSAKSATMALLVPDGVRGVTVTDRAGVDSFAPAKNNLVLVHQPGLFSATFDYAGVTQRVAVPPIPAIPVP